MPYFMSLEDTVAFFQSSLQLDATPCSLNGSLVLGMGTRVLITGIGACSWETSICLGCDREGRDGTNLEVEAPYI